MYEIFALIVFLVGGSDSSVVVDIENQDAVHISDYCPSSPHCVEGSHVMCMYYHPDRPMGPHCYDPQNVTMDTVLADKLVKLLNAVRAKLALGKEKGLNGELLPRAYGMMKLSWDSELATFAQVLANQCLLMHDLCRATSKFANPGQVIGSCRFTYPDWRPISNIQYHSTNLTQEKLLHAMTAIVKTWYSRKEYVTPTTVLQYPDWSKTSTAPKIYLEMIYGAITHVGCGVSASTTYSYSTRAEVILNIVIVVCNLSSRPSHDKPVYTTEQPTKVGYTVRCGCPPGYDEDENCLCTKTQELTTKEDKECFLKRCQPNMILLPIFTVEDAPPEKLIPPRFDSDLETFDVSHPVRNDTFLEHLKRYQKRTNKVNSIRNVRIKEQKRIGYQQTTIKPIMVDVPKRIFNKINNVPRISYHPKLPHAYGYAPVKKTSIFSQVPVFNLNKKGDESYVNNVQPRKNFTNAKKLAEIYLNQRKKQNQFLSPNDHINQLKSNTETYLTTAEEKVLNYNQYGQAIMNSNVSTPIMSSDDFTDLDSSHERSDDNLMHLLNKLEQKVKHTELNGVKRDIFEAKIRKIYGAVGGNPIELVSERYTDGTDTDFLEHADTDVEMDRKKYPELEDFKQDSKKLYHKPADFSQQTDFKEKNHDKDFENRRILTGRSRNALIHEGLDKDYVHDIRNKYDLDEFKYEPNLMNDNSKGIFRNNVEIQPRSKFLNKNKKQINKYPEKDSFRGQKNIEKRPLQSEKYTDVLGLERRKYYQNKLDHLERKLRESKKYQKHNNLLVRVKTREETPLRPIKTQLDPFYMADRARFLHGF